MRALVVDDDRATRFVLKMIFVHDLNCEVTEAASGREALDRLGEGTYDIVVLDVHLPGMSGVELLRIIRRTPAMAATRVVMLTSDGRDHIVKEAAQMGVEAYLVKPFDVEATVERLARLVRPGGESSG